MHGLLEKVVNDWIWIRSQDLCLNSVELRLANTMYVYDAQGMNGRNNQQNPSQCRNDYAEPHERPCHMLCLRQSEQGIQSAQNHQDCQHRLHIAEQHNIHILVCTAEHIGHTIHSSTASGKDYVDDRIEHHNCVFILCSNWED